MALEDEQWRAIRLVVDGDSYRSGPRAGRAVYARKLPQNRAITVRTDRYIAWPGQATAYKVGQLTILRLREEARKELGERFDIRAFHDEVLGAGALPMDVLEQRIKAWVARAKAGSAKTAS